MAPRSDVQGGTLGGLALLASLFGLTLRHRPEVTHEAITEGPKTKTA